MKTSTIKQPLLLALAAFACTAALAQSPTAGPGGKPEQAQTAGAGSKAEKKADMKVEDKKANTAMSPMDANGDGMVSRKEYDRYHSAMWGTMKPKNGMVSMADWEAARKGGPN